MTERFRLAALFSLTALLMTPATAKSKSDHDVFKSLIDQYWAAWSSGDIDKAGTFYDKSANAVYFDVTPLKYAGWNEYKEGVKKLIEEAKSVQIGANEDLTVTRHGNSAWTTETFHFNEVLKSGKTVELQGRHTTIWEKRNGHWIIIHEHVSFPMG